MRLLAAILFLVALAAAGLAVLMPPADSAIFAAKYPVGTCTPAPLPISLRASTITPDGDVTAATTLVITLASTVATGDTVVGQVSWDTGSGASLSSVIDNKGNGYQILDTVPDSAHLQTSADFYATNITNAPTSITATFSIAAAYRFASADEFVNVLGVTPLDGHAGNLQSTPGLGSNAVTSGSITTTVAHDMIWGGTTLVTSSPTGVNSGTSFTTGVNSAYLASEFLVQTTAGAQAATFTLTSGTPDTITFAAAFKAASSCSVPPPPTTLDIGAFNGGDASGEANTEAFETWLGRSMNFAVEFGGDASQSDFTGSTGFEFSLWPNGRKLLYSQPLIWTGATLAAAASGTYDSEYASVAADIAAAAAAGKVYAIRIGWEENGDWYPWSIHSGSPADYAAAYRRLALAIRAAYPAAKFDWNQNWGQTDPAAAYPGDDVVDYITMDVYENSAYTTGTCTDRWNQFVSQPSGFASLTTVAAFAAAHGKPMGISEYASNYNDGCFVQNMHDWIVSHTFAYQSYWNSTSAFNGLLSNYPVNQTVYYNNWHGIPPSPTTCLTGAPIDVTAAPYNAVADGTTNNITAFTNALAAGASAGRPVHVPAAVGAYAYSGDIPVVAGSELYGDVTASNQTATTLKPLDPNNSALEMTGDKPIVHNLYINGSAPTRLSNPQSSGVFANRATHFLVQNVGVNGVGSVGFFTGSDTGLVGSSNGRITSNMASNTLADSFHETNGSSNIEVDHNASTNSGDDEYSVVTYDPSAITNNIYVHDNYGTGGHTRGLSFVGGNSVTYYHNNISTGSCDAALYLATESGFTSPPIGGTSNISFNTLLGSGGCQGTIQFFAESNPITGVTIQNNQVLNPVADIVQSTGTQTVTATVQNQNYYYNGTHNNLNNVNGAATFTTSNNLDFPASSYPGDNPPASVGGIGTNTILACP